MFADKMKNLTYMPSLGGFLFSGFLSKLSLRNQMTGDSKIF